jgi:hypothetical protein
MGIIGSKKITWGKFHLKYVLLPAGEMAFSFVFLYSVYSAVQPAGLPYHLNRRHRRPKNIVIKIINVLGLLKERHIFHLV